MKIKDIAAQRTRCVPFMAALPLRRATRIRQTLTIGSGIVVMLLLLARPAFLSAADLTMWYNAPAKYETPKPGLNHALPIGNGMQGSLIFGGIESDRLEVDDISLWSGDENPSGAVRDIGMGSYLLGGEIGVDFTGQSNPATDYRRALDLASAIATVSYRIGSTDYRREYFASFPARVQVAHYQSSSPGGLSGTVWYKDGNGAAMKSTDGGLSADGALKNGLRYGLRLRVIPEGGTVTAVDGKLQFANCTGLTLLWTFGTDYIMDGTKNWHGDAPGPRLDADLAAAAAKPLAALRESHVSEYRSWFDRVHLDLGAPTAEQAALPTDRRQEAASKTPDPSFAALKFQHGRYLLISCSRPGGLPANLQGLWNDSNTPAWNSDYHTNINIQMNYWLAEVTNLSECHLPLFDLIESQLPYWRTATAADRLFALNGGQKVRGWTVRTSHNTRGGMGWKWDNTSNAWYALHFWEHYAFTGDRDFLAKRAYPILKEVAEFWEDHLKRQPDGTLVVPKGWSPEHGPSDIDGTSYCQQIVYDLFTNYVEAADVLGIDKEYRDRVDGIRKAMAGPRIGKWGQLMEWPTELSENLFSKKADFINQHCVEEAYKRLANRNEASSIVVNCMTPEEKQGLTDPAKRSADALIEALNRTIAGPSLANHPALATIVATPRMASLVERGTKDANVIPFLNKCLIIQALELKNFVNLLDTPLDNHRHTSHLFAVYPGRQISVEKTPDLAKGALASLYGRGAEGDFREWSAAWRCNLFARLRQGDEAFSMIQALHKRSTPNLFGLHPPMQIDGALGITAGIAEMLLQSHAEVLDLLPALPKAWPTGEVHGVHARGGITVDIRWKDGALVEAVLHPTSAGTISVRLGTTSLQGQSKGQSVQVTRNGKKAEEVAGERFNLKTTAGETITLLPKAKS